MNGFVRKSGYYRGVVYEWNLPTGSSCPFAMECKVTVDRVTGKFDVKRGAYRCYAASAERFPAVRNSRWRNYAQALSGQAPKPPKGCNAVRIHMAGDFFNQAYFDLWLGVAEANPEIEFWAYTKSLNYWIARLDRIPDNLILTASYGGRLDHLIERYNLKNVQIYRHPSLVPADRPIDTNDDWARRPHVNFALIDNNAIGKTKQKQL